MKRLNIFCKKCQSLIPVCDLNELSYLSLKSTPKPACAYCRILLSSSFSSNLKTYDPGTENLHLPDQFVYVHTNEEFETSIHLKNYAHKNVLFVSCGGLKRVTVLRNISEYNFKRCVCLSRDKDWAYDIFDGWIEAEHEDLTQKEATLATLNEYTNNHGFEFDAVLTYDDYSGLMATYLANELNLPSMPLELACRVKNKYEFRRLCVEIGINTPKFLLIKSDEREKLAQMIRDRELTSLKSENGHNVFRFPVIAKNPFGCGKGITFLSQYEFLNHDFQFLILIDFCKKSSLLENLAESIEESILFSQNMDLLIEEFYDGLNLFRDFDLTQNMKRFKRLIFNKVTKSILKF
jgi:hypothetical protein